MPYGDANADGELVLVCAPTGRDAALTKQILEKASLASFVCTDVEDLCARMSRGAAVVLLDERVLDESASKCLHGALAQQGEWSDFPIVLFSAGALARDRKATESSTSLGNVTYLDRPVQVRTMLAAVTAGVRARRRQYQARRAITLREHFLAMLGHELRNPLASIRLAVEASAGDATNAKRWSIVDRQSAHLARLVDDLLDVARVTNGKITLQREHVDLSEVVRSCFLAQRPSAERAGLQYELSGDDTTHWVDGDRLRLDQIVNNLLTNAIKYTKEGRIEVSLRSVDDAVELAVVDSGIGMTSSTRARVFDLFAQADESLDRSDGGMGLGLTVVRGLVELHRGTVEARSDGPGCGSSFIVTIPRGRTEMRRRPRRLESDARGRSARAKTVVIVDDNDDLRELLGELLTAAGHHVVTAGDGRAGLDCILGQRPDVALVDLGLPVLDGYELARRARAAGVHAMLVAVSGYGQRADRQRAIAAGFDEHMKKPIDLRRLASTIQCTSRPR